MISWLQQCFIGGRGGWGGGGEGEGENVNHVPFHLVSILIVNSLFFRLVKSLWTLVFSNSPALYCPNLCPLHLILLLNKELNETSNDIMITTVFGGREVGGRWGGWGGSINHMPFYSVTIIIVNSLFSPLVNSLWTLVFIHSLFYKNK